MTNRFVRNWTPYFLSPDDAGAAAAAAATAAGKTEADATAATTAAKLASDKAATDAAASKLAADAAAKVADTRVVPEKYELKLPNGNGTPRLDASDLEQLATLAKEHQLTQDEAQKLVDSQVEAIEAASLRFLEQTTADKDYGGPKLAETQRLANLALEKLRPKGTPRGDALRSLLDRTGYGNHIEVIALLADLGKQQAEDVPPDTRKTPRTDEDRAKRLYTHPDSQKLA